MSAGNLQHQSPPGRLSAVKPGQPFDRGGFPVQFHQMPCFAGTQEYPVIGPDFLPDGLPPAGALSLTPPVAKSLAQNLPQVFPLQSRDDT